MKHILVVEDDHDIAQLLTMHLRDIDCEVTVASDGKVGYTHLLNRHYDLVILDIMLPGIDGLELCKSLRNQSDYTPVLMLTARSSELDRVLGLEIGADDYLTKPFSIRELIARVKAIFRRIESISDKETTDKNQQIRHYAALVIDTQKRHVKINDNEIDLTAKEFDLLWHFTQHPGQVFTRSQLLDSVWGYGHDGYEHTVNSHINRLRAKIEKDPSKPTYILTVWGIGYKFSDKFST
ncbi:MAG: response regulator transcription factor [Gammaproteobacteria bacterium]|nr:response regulator transcription factor [Gammaproteobacteria bacterium]